MAIGSGRAQIKISPVGNGAASVSPHTYQEDGDPREAYVVEGNGPVVGVEPLGLARVEVLIPVDAVRLFWRQ